MTGYRLVCREKKIETNDVMCERVASSSRKEEDTYSEPKKKANAIAEIFNLFPSLLGFAYDVGEAA